MLVRSPKRSAIPVRPLRPPTASATTKTVAWKSLTVRVRACKTGFHSRQRLDDKEGRHRKVPPFLCSSYKPVWGGAGRPSPRPRFGRLEGELIRGRRSGATRPRGEVEEGREADRCSRAAHRGEGRRRVQIP